MYDVLWLRKTSEDSQIVVEVTTLLQVRDIMDSITSILADDRYNFHTDMVQILSTYRNATFRGTIEYGE